MPIEVGEDPVVRPVTEIKVDENGTTIVIGWPSSGSSGAYDGPIGTDPGEGSGGLGPGGGEGTEG